MITAIQCQFNGKLLPLPKLVVLVPDDDIIKLFSQHDYAHGITKPMSRVLNHIMTDHERTISAYKEYLPTKSVKQGFPHILWIQAPLHQNFRNNNLHVKFNKCLSELIPLHSNISTLELKKVWDPNDGNLFLAESQRFTSEGLRAYWEAVDRTVRYCDSVLLKKQEKRKNLKSASSYGNNKAVISFKSLESDQKDRFKWQNLFLNKESSGSRSFKKLPTPPPRCSSIL